VTTVDYAVGDFVVQRLYSGRERVVRVTERTRNVKDGKPGFDGVNPEEGEVWGFDDQIERVVRRAVSIIVRDDDA
jgi:hypothetical protein